MRRSNSKVNFRPPLADCVLTRVAGGLISAAPLGEPAWRAFEGLLIEIVEKREGMRGRRPWAVICSCICERLEALVMGPSPNLPLGGWAWDELESLILAQNERWRHA